MNRDSESWVPPEPDSGLLGEVTDAEVTDAEEAREDAADAAERSDAEPGRANTPRSRHALVETLLLVVTALLLAMTLKTYVAEAYEIKGSSMLPTFHNGERVVVLKTFYGIARGDIVIFRSTEDPDKDLIKRVVGLPGDHIRIEFGEVFVNGVELAESYLNEEDLDRSGLFGLIEETVKPDEYYVLGDNRGDSHDSRRFRGVPVENIKGKVVVRWWPLEGFRSF